MNIDLVKYKEITDNQIVTLLKNAKLFKSEIVTHNDNAYYEVLYQMRQGLFLLKIHSFCFIKNDKAYLITFSTELVKYEAFESIGNEILDSFKLKK